MKTRLLQATQNLEISGVSVIEQIHTQAPLVPEEVRVNMAELAAEKKPVEMVACVGSCIALCIYDSSAKCGGMAHIMLPDASICPDEMLPAKFADTAVPALAKAIKKLSNGCLLSAKIAGGANMFPNIRNQTIAIGTRNIEAVKATLSSNRIPLKGEDVGGTQGRKVTFNNVTGRVCVRLLNGDVREL